MRQLTEAGERQVAAIAAQHGVGREAALLLLHALAAGGGTMAQFSHPEIGGMGQWSRGGLVMVGDMSNHDLKARVDALCRALASVLRGTEPVFVEAASGAVPGGWWPAELGGPAASGTQNGIGYALFPVARRLAVRQDGQVRIFDTGEHRIAGVAQQQGSGQVLTFDNDRGEVRLESLREVGDEATARSPTLSPGRSRATPAAAASQPTAAGGDPLAMIQRLAELHRQGVLTEPEFQAKKTELLGRL